MGMVRVRGRAPGPRQNQSENDGREISRGGPPCEISQAVPDASRAVPVLADLKFRAVTRQAPHCYRPSPASPPGRVQCVLSLRSLSLRSETLGAQKR